VACGSPAAGHIGALVALAQRDGWQVCVVATPAGRKFIDPAALAHQTGHPVRSDYKNPGDPDVLPAADAIVVAPATVNTVNKWACGIADTLALGMLVEGYGLGVPIVAMPYTNTAMAAHPAFRESLRRLRSWGVRVLFGDDVLVLPPPGGGALLADRFPWQLALTALGPPRRILPGPHGPDPGLGSGPGAGPAIGAAPGAAGGRLWPANRAPRAQAGTRALRPAPPQSPRPGLAIVRTP
jgi:hypothetical protein